MSVITNIDNDHLDYYGTIENLQEAFSEFSNKVPFYGIVALNANDKPSVDLIQNLKRPYKFFGIENLKQYSEKIDYLAKDVVETENGANFILDYDDQSVPLKISLSGNHNISNALGAIILAHRYGAKLQDIASAIVKFEGVSRRQETIYKENKFIIVDDYAHHPTEIIATIQTLKKKYHSKKLVVCFEPHRFSRTKNFWNEFVNSFTDVDHLVISPIYAANEKPIDYIDAQILAKNISGEGIKTDYIECTEDISKTFFQYKGTETVILTLGAGSISRIAKGIVENDFTK